MSPNKISRDDARDDIGQLKLATSRPHEFAKLLVRSVRDGNNKKKILFGICRVEDRGVHHLTFEPNIKTVHRAAWSCPCKAETTQESVSCEDQAPVVCPERVHWLP